MNKRTGVFANGLIWFGAAVSIAEIITGTLFAPLGFYKGMLAVIIGHIIGGILMFAAGMIGAKERRSSMETVKISFGSKGAIFFAILNIMQLVGWTAIMIYDGALAANGILNTGLWMWALVIGGLIIVWLLIGLSNLGKLNTIAMGLLFVLSLVMFKIIFFDGGHNVGSVGEAMSFGAALELAVAMPLSWLPLISDYTREAQKPVKATLVSVIVYSLVSSFMYMIGLGASLFAQTGDIDQIMLKAGLGIVGLLIIVFSTVTTTFMDAYSAGVSALSISEKLNEKLIAIIVTIVGTVAAMLYPMDNISNFLYLIGSVFAPMIAIQIADYFIIKNRREESFINFKNTLAWICGFVIYRLLLKQDIAIGSSLLDIIITIMLCLIFEWISKLFKK